MSKLFNKSDEIKKIIKEELELFNNASYKGLNVPNIYESRILEAKKLILIDPTNAKQYFQEKSAYLEKLQAELEQKFKEDYLKFKDILGIKKAKELTLKSVTHHKSILLEGAQYLFPDVLDDIAERALLADARKNIK
jgi:predicted ATPase with chaperone activity